MKRILIVSCFLLDLCFVSPVSAEVFERDWKAPGDGLLTHDDVNGREWLDLSVSRLINFRSLDSRTQLLKLHPAGCSRDSHGLRSRMFAIR